MSPIPQNIPQVKFDGRSSYKDQFKGYQFSSQQLERVKPCAADNLPIPVINYVNEGKHIYYDPDSKKFL